MRDIVTDTHALLWYLLEPAKLSMIAQTAIDEAADNGIIYVPSVSIVELRYLVEKGKFKDDVFNFVMDSIADPDSSLMVAVLDTDTAKTVGRIARATVPDMPDRIIAATALWLGLPLVTCDHKIIASGIPTIW